MGRPVVEHVVEGKQTCRRCKVPKKISEFWKNSHKAAGISQYCKPCSNLNRQETRQRIKTGTTKFIVGQYKKGTEEYKNRTKDRMLQYGYGITLEEYNKLFFDQKGCCAICKTHQSSLTKALHVDHCHQTNKVRGLLCSKCNTALGLLNDSNELLSNAVRYLDEHNAFIKNNSWLTNEN